MVQGPSILVPRLRRLRDEKRAMGTRMYHYLQPRPQGLLLDDFQNGGSTGGNKFVSYIHEMENPHRISITIYGTTRHTQSLDVTLHH